MLLTALSYEHFASILLTRKTSFRQLQVFETVILVYTVNVFVILCLFKLHSEVKCGNSVDIIVRNCNPDKQTRKIEKNRENKV